MRKGATPGLRFPDNQFHESEELRGIFAVDGGKHFQELVECETVGEVVEQSLRGYASGAEDERAAHHVRVGSYRARVSVIITRHDRMK